MRLSATAALFAVSAIAPAAHAQAAAQRAAQFARLDTVARYVAIAPWCERIGYTVDRTQLEPVEDVAVAEAVSAGVDQEAAEARLDGSIERQIRVGDAERSRAAAGAKRNPALRRELVALLERDSRRCGEAAADSTFRLVVTPPSPEEVPRLKKAAIDGYLSSIR